MRVPGAAAAGLFSEHDLPQVSWHVDLHSIEGRHVGHLNRSRPGDGREGQRPSPNPAAYLLAPRTRAPLQKGPRVTMEKGFEFQVKLRGFFGEEVG